MQSCVILYINLVKRTCVKPDYFYMRPSINLCKTCVEVINAHQNRRRTSKHQYSICQDLYKFTKKIYNDESPRKTCKSLYETSIRVKHAETSVNLFKNIDAVDGTYPPRGILDQNSTP